MARSFNVSFNITGALDGSLMAAIRNAANAMRGLGNSARAASAAAKASEAGLKGLATSLNSIQNAAGKFKALNDALNQTATNFNRSTATLGAAKAKMEADAQAADKLRQKLAQLNAELGKAKTDKVTAQDGLKTLRQQMQDLKRAFDLAKSLGNTAQMQALSSQMTTLGASIQAQQAKVKAAAQAYKELSDKVKQAKIDLKAAEQAASASGKSYGQAQREAQRLSQSFQQQYSALSQLKASLAQAGFNVSNFAASEARLESEINRVNTALERQANLQNAQRASSQASQEMFNAYNNFQGALQTATQIAAPFQSAAENAMNFEYAMSKVKSLTQMRNIRAGNFAAVEREMAALTAQAEELGATTEFTSQEVAEAMGFYGMAGWDTTRIQNAMQHTIDLATIAGDHNIQRMADVLSDDMTAMGLKAGEMITLQNGKVVESSKYFGDAFAYALTNANVNRESLHEALKYNAPIAKQWGLTMGEEFAINMMSANAGIKGSMAGTGLRAGLLRISAPPKKAAKAFAEMGLSMSDAQKELAEGQAAMKAYGVTIGDFATTLRSLGQVYNSLGKAERLGFVDAVFGKNASSFWANILDKGNIESVLQAAQEIDTGWIEDYASDTAAVMRDNTKISIELLKSSIDALERSIGQALTPTIRAVAESFAPLVTAAGQWVAANPAIVQAAAGIAAAFAGIIVSAAAVKLAFAGFGFVVAQFRLLGQAASAFRLGLMGIATEGGGVAAAMGALGMRVAALRAAFAGLATYATLGGWGAMFGAIAARAAAARVAIVGFFASLSLSSMAAGAVSAMKMITTAIAGAARAAFAFAFSPVGVTLMALALAGLYCYQNWEKVAPVLSNIASIVTGSLSGALATIAPAIQNVMTAISNLANALGSSGLFSTLGMMITGVLATIATGVAGALATVINTIATIISTVANVLSGIVNLVSSVISGNWSAAWDAMKSIATSALQGIADVAKGILDGILSTVQAIGKAWEFLSGDTTVARENALKQAPSSAPANTVMPTAQPAPMPETPQIDTTATQAGLDAVGQSAQTAAAQMDGVNTATQNISQAGDAFAQVPAAVQPVTSAMAQIPPAVQPVTAAMPQLAASVQPASAGLQQMGSTLPQVTSSAQNLSTSLQTDTSGLGTHTGALQSNSAALEANIGALQAFGAACNGAVGGVTSLGNAASSAAGAVLGLGSAAQSACAQLAAAGANAAAQVSAAASSISVKANAEGGIYRKGAFLTTFAERSPEAAIPLDNSKRAKSLWQTVGQMLGILPGDAKIPWSEGGLPTSPGLPEAVKRYPLPTSPKMPGNAPKTPLPISRRSGGYRGDTRRVQLPKSPFEYGRDMPRVNRSTRGFSLPSLLGRFPSIMAPTPTFPPLDNPQRQDDGGLFGKLAGGLFGSSHDDSSLPPINLTVHVTISGNADESTIKRSVEESVPTVQRSLAAELRNYKREQLRRSYA